MSNDTINTLEIQLRWTCEEIRRLSDERDLLQKQYRHLEATSGNQLTVLTQYFAEAQKLRQEVKDLKQENAELKTKLNQVCKQVAESYQYLSHELPSQAKRVIGDILDDMDEVRGVI